MKIYTRTGDDGSTALFGGKRVSKSDTRVGAYGTVDELNACLGVVRATLSHASAQLGPVLLRLQSELFDLGAQLATDPEHAQSSAIARLEPIGSAHVAGLESLIDEFDAQLPELRTFILPGGSHCASALHVARTVARRAERSVILLSEHEPVDINVIRYLNRVSDLLFVLARFVNKIEGVDDLPWTNRRPVQRGGE